MSCSEWKEYRIGEICDIISSKRIYSREYVTNGIPFYRSKEIIKKHNNEEITDVLYISVEKFNELDKKFGTPTEGEMLLTSVGTLGIPYIIKRNEKFYFKDGNLTWFRNFSNEIKSNFLYYWVLSPIGKNDLNKITIGSTQQALTIDSLKKMKIKLPSFKEQNRIIKFLTSLDHKIEFNNKINKTLEEIAQAIFKHWFVDFEFPNENSEPYKSSGGKFVESELGMIPERWKVEKLSEICEFNKETYSISEKWEYINYLDTGNITKNSINKIQTFNCLVDKIPSRAKRKVKPNDIVYSTVRPKQLHYGIIKEPIENLLVSTGFVVLTSKGYISNDIVYYWLTQEGTTKKLQAIADQSTTTYPSIKLSDIQSIKILIPLKDQLNKITTIVKKINNKIWKNQQQNNTLIEIRDILLPKLMSGEIRIPEAE